MSVLDPKIDHLDTAAKLIYLAEGVRSIHPIDDIYHEVRNQRANTEGLQQYLNPVSGGGAVPKGGGKFTPRYAVFNNGWRMVPEDVSHTLNVTGEQLTAEGGSGPSCFDFSVLSSGTRVIVNYEPPAAEIIYVTGAQDLNELIAAVAQLSTDVGGVASDVGDVNTAVGSVSSDVGDVNNAVGSVSSAVAAVDSALGGLVLSEQDTAAVIVLVRKLLQNRTHTNPATHMMTVFDDDDATPLVTANLYEDVAGATPYSVGSQRIDRRNRLQ